MAANGTDALTDYLESCALHALSPEKPRPNTNLCLNHISRYLMQSPKGYGPAGSFVDFVVKGRGGANSAMTVASHCQNRAALRRCSDM